MKIDSKTFLNKSLVALTLLLGVSPVFFMLGAGLLPDHPAYWYLFPCAACLLGILSYIVPDRHRMAWTALSAVLLTAAGLILLLPLGVLPFFLLLAALILLFLLPPAYRRPLGAEWPISVWATCLCAHLAANLMSGSGSAFAPVRTPLTVAFALFALSGALLINYISLRGGMGSDTRPPKTIRRRNMLATALMYALALIAALWDTVARALQAAVDFIKYIIFTVLDFIAGLFPEQGAPGDGGGGDMDLSALMGEAPPEPSAFARLMEKIFIGIAVALAAAAALFCLFLIGKKLVRLLKKLLARLREYASSVGEGYTDQAESTFSLEQWTQAAREGVGRLLRRRERPTPWKQLDGRARVRRLYADYLKRRPAAPADTAREALMRDKRLPAAGEFAALYDRARYSAHDIDPADADALRARVADEGK